MIYSGTNVNVSAFLAHLSSTGFCMSVADGEHVGIKLMMEIFGRQGKVIKPSSEIKAMSAAQWIIVNAQGLFQTNLTAYGWLIMMPMHKGDQTQGNFEKAAMQDWKVWRNGFEAVKLNEKFSQECHQLADKAVRMMDLVKEIMA
jgi:hypothetical protein